MAPKSKKSAKPKGSVLISVPLCPADEGFRQILLSRDTVAICLRCTKPFCKVNALKGHNSTHSNGNEMGCRKCNNIFRAGYAQHLFDLSGDHSWPGVISYAKSTVQHLVGLFGTANLRRAVIEEDVDVWEELERVVTVRILTTRNEE